MLSLDVGIKLAALIKDVAENVSFSVEIAVIINVIGALIDEMMI